MKMTKDNFKCAVKDIHSYYSRKVTDPVIDLWWEEVGSYPESAVLSTSRLWCRRNRTVPTIEEFEDLLMAELKGSGFNKGWRPNPAADSQWTTVKAMLENRSVAELVEKLQDLRANSGIGTWNPVYWRVNDWFVEYVGSEERWGRFLYNTFKWKERRPEWTGRDPLHWETSDLQAIFSALPPRDRIPPLGPHSQPMDANLVGGLAVMPGTES